MKITFVLPGGGRSGGVKCTVKVANGLLRKGHKIRLLVNKGGRSLRTQLRDIWLRTRHAGGNDWLNLFKGPLERFSDIERCVFENNEIVVASGWWAGTEIRRLNDNGIIKVHHVRGMLKEADQMRAAWGENVPKIVVASFLQDTIEQTCGQKVYAIIPDGIDAAEFYPSVQESQRDGVGTIFGKGYHKDPETVLGVLEGLNASRPKIPLRVFSANRKPKNIPREIYHRLPSLEKARDIYSRSLVWFLGSYSEGFGLPVLEAMACGCAVVSTSCGGPQDIINNGENGFLVNVGDIEQIVHRVQELLDDVELRRQFVKNSKKTLEKFSWERSINKLEKALSNLATSRFEEN
ncbi:MAG: glycosyltransferase family 4 protein [Sedimentisphaerales bacterium]|nr:glycosyltransferase family 4 protein [Sedimentisphaerales bacterium]